MKVLIADDHELILHGISHILKRNAEVNEIHSATNLYELNNVLDNHKIDL